MEDYNQIIDSLSVRFVKARNINILSPVTIENNYEVENTLLLVHRGEVSYNKEKNLVEESEILFVPAGKMMSITYGSGAATSLKKEEFLGSKSKYLENTKSDELAPNKDSYSFVAFEAKAFDSVNFFNSLDIPAFKISNQKNLAELIMMIVKENEQNAPGRDRMISLLTERLVIEMVRHILENGLFVEQFATNSTYFKDPRLIDLFGYIKENLNQDLSNKVLAQVASVSEDYVGQYFKMLTGINPQDYIEYQRMEMAVNLLRSSKRSIRDIGKDVGYKDTAYFCRRFKMMFGIPAGKMRKRESLISA